MRNGAIGHRQPSPKRKPSPKRRRGSSPAKHRANKTLACASGSDREARFRARSFRRWLVVGVGGLALALMLGARLLPNRLQLVICPAGGGKPLLMVPLELGERFTLRYVHSVDHTPIWEEHSADQYGTIYIEQERFVMFGAGMGHWEGHGTLTRRGPYQVIENIHKPIGDFVLRVGSKDVDHTLIWRGQSLHLSRLAAGEAVSVSVRTTGLLERLWHSGLEIGDRRLEIGDWGASK